MDEQGRYQRSTNMEIACGKFGYGPVRSEYMQCEQATPHGDTEGIDREYSFYFSTPEDIILAKLDCYRNGNFVSSQQWRDISNVIRIQGEKLDLDYLRTWASELKLSDLLEQALAESLLD